MKANMKKTLAMVLAMAMIFALCACGSSSAPAASTSTSSSEASAPAAAAPEKNTIKMGGIGPLTGDAAIYGTAAMNGAKIAVDEINAAGGINGVMVEFKAEDDVCDSESSVNAYNNLMDWGMDVLVGSVTSGCCISVSAEAYKDRVFALTPSASSTDVTAGKDNMFQLCFTDPNQGLGAAQYIAANMGTDYQIAIIYRNDDAYSTGIRDTFVAEAANQNLNVVYEGTFTADTATDFSIQLKGAQAAGANFVFLPIYYQPASVILAQAKAMDFAPIFFGVDGMDGILTLENFDLSLAEGVMLLTPFSAKAADEKTANFVAAYEGLFGETPNQFAADGYDCVYALKQAMEQMNYQAGMPASELCDALIKEMTSMSFDGVTGSGMSWSSNGEVSKLPIAVVINNGEYEIAG